MEIAGRSHGISVPSVSGGFWLASKAKLRGTVNRAFRLPNYTDLYYHDPANIGNPNLRPEHAMNYEGGLDFYPADRWRSSVTSSLATRRMISIMCGQARRIFGKPRILGGLLLLEWKLPLAGRRAMGKRWRSNTQPCTVRRRRSTASNRNTFLTIRRSRLLWPGNRTQRTAGSPACAPG